MPHRKKHSHPQAPLYYPGNAAVQQAEQLSGSIDTPAENITPGTFAGGDFIFPNNLKVTEYLDLMEISTPATPPAATARIYAFDFHGETRLRVELPDGVRFDMMADNTVIARNTSGGTITKGQVVYVSGASGNVPTIDLAQANSLTTLSVVGVAQETMNNNDFGTVNFSGTVIFDTSAFMAGDSVYVSATTPGALTATRPTYPNIIQNIGVVMVSGVGNGELLIVPQERDTGLSPWAGVTDTPTTFAGYGIVDVLGNLDDVNAPMPDDGDVLTWDDIAGEWISSPAPGSGTIDGSGTANRLAKWSDSDTLTNSIIRDDGSSAFVNIAASDPFSVGFGLYVNVGLEQLREAAAPTMNFSRVNGTFGSPSGVASPDNLGRFIWRGYDGSSLGTGVIVEALASETWSGSAHGAGMRIVTVANGGTGGAVRLNITHDGLVTTPASRAEGALTADMTGFTNTSTNLTNQSFAIGASEVWVFDFFGWLNTSGAGGCLFNFTVPSGCTGEFHTWGNGSTTANLVSGRQATLTSNSPSAVNTGSGNDGHVHVRAILINSTTAGTIQLRGLSTAGGSTITMRKGSHFTARRIS